MQSTGNLAFNSLWKPLVITTADSDLPPLLARYEFGQASYTIHVTDLTSIWLESLDRKQIIKRALNLNTSIDPSEDATQMQLLLRYVRESLEGHEGTNLVISADHKSDELDLTVSVVLPSPLLPFEWPLTMNKASPSVFHAQFVLPTLGLCSLAQAQVASLLQHLKEKDHVINKLTQRLQSEGSDLSRIFPGVSTTRNGSKPQARGAESKTVKGLSEFNEDHWRRQFSSIQDAKSDVGAVLSSIFGSFPEPSRMLQPSSNDSVSWGRHLEHDKAASARPAPKDPLPDSDDTDSNHACPSGTDQFQRQSTPLKFSVDSLSRDRHMKDPLGGKEETNRKVYESTTEGSDDDDLHEGSMKSKARSKPSETENLPVGRFERSPNKLAKSRSSFVPQQSDDCINQTSMPERHMGEGRSGGESSDQSRHQEMSRVAKPRVHRLGKIGGKKEMSNAVMHNRETSPYARSDTESTVGKVDPIENQGARTSNQGAVVSEPSLRPQPTSSPRKVTEEQANNNRKRLQQDLEIRSKAEKRKKRKF